MAYAVNPDISPASTPSGVVISVGMSEPKDMPSVAHVPAGLTEEMQPPSKNRRGITKTGSTSLEDEYFRSDINRNNCAIEKYQSDIVKNQSDIENNQSDIVKNKSDFKHNESVIELNNLRAQVLKRQLQEDSQEAHNRLCCATYV